MDKKSLNRTRRNPVFFVIVIIILLAYSSFHIYKKAGTTHARRILLAVERIMANTGRSSSLSKSLAHFVMGIIYDNEARQEEAIREYKKAIELEPEVSYLHTRLGADYILSKKDEDSALEELKLAKLLDPADTKSRLVLALLYTAGDRFQEAKKEYEGIIRLDPDSIWALSSLADIMILEKKMDEAAAVYERLIAKEKESPLVYFNLGVIYARMGRLDEALQKFKEATKVDPQYVEAYIGLGVIYEAQGNYPKAIEGFEGALKIDPMNEAIYNHLGIIYQKQERFDEAIRQFEAMVRLNPNSAPAYIGWADVFIKAKKPRDAVIVLEKAIAIGVKEEEPRVHFYLGSLYEELGRTSDAVREFKEAIKLDPAFAEAYNYLGYMLAESGTNLDEAVDLVLKAVELEPDNGAFIDSLGWVYYKKGNLDKALELLEQAAKLDPDDLTIKEHLDAVKKKMEGQ